MLTPDPTSGVSRDCENVVFYYELPSFMNVIADNSSDVGYYLSGTDKAYSVHCCGAIASIDYKATTSGTIALQIWRSNTLVYQTNVSLSAGSQTYTFSPKIAIQIGDVIGWYSYGLNPIGKASSCFGVLCPSNTRKSNVIGPLAIGAYYDWSTATSLPNTAFAIKFNVVNGTVPSFTQSSPVYILETTGVGTSVAVVSLTDDVGDEFVFSPPGSAYFDYNSTSGLVSLIAQLPITNTPTPYFLTMEVFDSCFNSATIVVNITSMPVPPSFQNLPTEVELGDDVTEETLLIVINVTDPNTHSISCVQTSVVPNTTYFRLDDYMNGTAVVFLNANSDLDYKTTPEYQIFITCTGASSLESVLTIKIFDKSTSNAASDANAWMKLYLGPSLAGFCLLIIVAVLNMIRMKYKSGNKRTVAPVSQ